MLLTGNANLESAIQAVNDGHIFRFLTKPCSPDTLKKAVRAGVEQYRLIVAQKDLLENTLRASLNVLGEVLAMINPTAFGKALRVRQLVRDLIGGDGSTEWEIDIAAMLCQLGCIDIPQSVLIQADRCGDLSDREKQMLLRHPTVGFNLLRSIPRLERVAEIIAHQNHPYSDQRQGADGSQGSHLLKLALDYDTLLQQGEQATRALDVLKSREGWYEPSALAKLEVLVRKQVPVESQVIPISSLGIGMVLAADVTNTGGVVAQRRNADNQNNQDTPPESRCERGAW